MSLVGLASPDEGHGDNMGVTVMRKNDEKKESEISLDGEKTDSDQNVSNIDSKDNDPNLTIEGHVFEPEERDLTVYKFLGEEVSLEKGIVKKQKMGKVSY
jgi:hypothetical protein